MDLVAFDFVSFHSCFTSTENVSGSCSMWFRFISQLLHVHRERKGILQHVISFHFTAASRPQITYGLLTTLILERPPLLCHSSSALCFWMCDTAFFIWRVSEYPSKWCTVSYIWLLALHVCSHVKLLSSQRTLCMFTSCNHAKLSVTCIVPSHNEYGACVFSCAKPQCLWGMRVCIPVQSHNTYEVCVFV